jgi:hypothetical protein
MKEGRKTGRQEHRKKGGTTGRKTGRTMKPPEVNPPRKK